MRSRLASILVSLAIPLLVIVPGLSLARQAAGDAGKAVEVTYQTGGLRLTITTPAAALTPEGRVEVAGLNAYTNKPAASELPYYVTLIAAPPDGDVSIQLEESQVESRRMAIPAVAEVQVETVPLTGTDGLVALRELPEVRAAAPAVGAGRYPAAPYLLEGPFYLGELRVFRLAVFPLSYDVAAGELRHSRQVAVNISFAGEYDAVQEAGRPIAGGLWERLVFNPEQVPGWYSRAAGAAKSPETALPLDVPVFKIEVNADGIYDVSYEALQAAGMDVGNVNPLTFEMLYRGEPVAYQWNGNQDQLFEQNESVRFYGWAFDGSRLEKQFFVNNVFWLWAGGTPNPLDTVPSVGGNEVLSFRSTVTTEPENHWFASWTDQWDDFPNEPDAWYWDKLEKSGTGPMTRTYEVTLPHPAAIGATAAFTAEFSSKLSPAPGGNSVPHAVEVYLNDQMPGGSASWYDQQNVNVIGEVDQSDVLIGTNQFGVVLATAAVVGGSNTVYLNRFTVEYDRLFVADANQLFFTDSTPSSRSFSISGYTLTDPDDVLIWDITDRQAPAAVAEPTIGGNGTYTFGTSRSGSAAFIATNTAGLHLPEEISRYVGSSLDPTEGADWVALAYHDFLTETETLAAHRAEDAFGGLMTHVVDAADVINQYGYGLPIPSAIQDYFAHAQGSWPVAPRYALLVGDATVNPRGNLDNGLPFSETQFLLTDLAFVDRYQGQIPSDYTFGLLAGDDLLPELAVGRIPAKSAGDVAAAVDKIILYEQNHLSAEPWMANMLFVSDDPDSAGDFCVENQAVGAHFPDAFLRTNLCLPAGATYTQVNELRAAMFSHINATGTTLLNYRGHGGVTAWGGAGGTTILNTSQTALWQNADRPIVIATGDCLDGYFVHPNGQGLAETFFRLQDKGTAAHWSSSGLGLTGEHSELVEAFYDGLYAEGLTAVGDAANYAKVQFHLVGGHRSLLYSFVLQGDPAMQLMRRDLVVAKDGPAAPVPPGETADFYLTVGNAGLYPSYTILTDTLPTGLTFVEAAGSVPIEVTVAGQQVIVELAYADAGLNKGLPLGASATVTLTAELDEGLGGGTLVNQVVGGGTGLEANPVDNTAAFSLGVDANYTPAAYDDVYNMTEVLLNVAAPGVLANDVDPDGDVLTAQLVTPPADGTVELHADGSFSFTVPEGYGGIATFVYRAVDADGAGDLATVYIRVLGQRRFLPLINAAAG